MPVRKSRPPAHDRSQPLLNKQTPRVFIAATRQDEGKTTFALGLFHALKARFKEIGYIKPVGQRCINVNGMRIDEDSVLMERTYAVRVPIEDMSPLAIGKQFTRKFLATDATEGPLVDRLRRAFDRAAWEKDFVIIEGSGHAGVGSVFGLSNARIAKILDSPAIIVTRGGIGDPIDDVSLGLALFEKYKARVIGVIFNKVFTDKIDTVKEFAGRALARIGVNLLGIIPVEPLLAHPTGHQIARDIGAVFLAGEQHGRSRIRSIQLWTGPRTPLPRAQGTLVIKAATTASAGSLVVDLATAPQSVACVVFCHGEMPRTQVLSRLSDMGIASIGVTGAPFDTMEAIRKMSVKIETDDHDKIQVIQEIVERHVDIDRVLRLCRR